MTNPQRTLLVAQRKQRECNYRLKRAHIRDDGPAQRRAVEQHDHWLDVEYAALCQIMTPYDWQKEGTA